MAYIIAAGVIALVAAAAYIVQKKSRSTTTRPVMRPARMSSIFSGNSGGTRSINIDISGPDLQTLFDAGFKVFTKSKQIFENPRVKSEPSSLKMGQPMLEVRPDWERAAELGIAPGDLGYTVWAYSDGAYVDDFFLDDDETSISAALARVDQLLDELVALDPVLTDAKELVASAAIQIE